METGPAGLLPCPHLVPCYPGQGVGGRGKDAELAVDSVIICQNDYFV